MNKFLFVGFVFTKNPKDLKKYLQITVYANCDETIVCFSEGLGRGNFEMAEFGLGKFVEESEILPFIQQRYPYKVSYVKNILETIPNNNGPLNWVWVSKRIADYW